MRIEVTFFFALDWSDTPCIPFLPFCYSSLCFSSSQSLSSSPSLSLSFSLSFSRAISLIVCVGPCSLLFFNYLLFIHKVTKVPSRLLGFRNVGRCVLLDARREDVLVDPAAFEKLVSEWHKRYSAYAYSGNVRACTHASLTYE